MRARTSRYIVPPEVERSSEAHRCDRRIALEVSHAEKPQDAGQDEHGADEDERMTHVGLIADDTDDDGRDHVAQRVYDEDVEREAGRPDRRVADVRENRVRRPGVEEEAKAAHEE